MTGTPEKAVFTYASGSKYLALAYALSRSYKQHNGFQIPFYVVSNQDFELPADLKKWAKKKIVDPELTGKGLEFKLKLHQLAPAVRNIFVDSDSLIYGDISYLFNLFEGSALNVIGTEVITGEWADENIESLCKEFSIAYAIRYCGALYYIRKSEQTERIFEEAGKLLNKRSFQKHAHNFNEEPLLSVAMSRFGVHPVADDGNTWSDLVQFKQTQKLNIFNPESSVFANTAGHTYKFWLPDGEYRPRILHMGGAIYNKNPWLFDHLRLLLKQGFRVPEKLADLLISRFVRPAYFAIKKAKL
ncbi:MAG: hypothetical protein K0S09_3162 [Sphingobacteriaceae bacterium]|nr:hypothetical protein [Sphingobacteriaceae bacterium]